MCSLARQVYEKQIWDIGSKSQFINVKRKEF